MDDAASRTALTGSDSTPGNRRLLPSGQVSLLFSDIEGSTRMLLELGDAYGEVLATHRRLLREVWGRHDGVEVDTEGDAFFVAFPLAQEAVAAAEEAQRVVAAAAELAGLRVRIGVHTGAPQIRDGDYWGEDVHYAARLCAAANGGQVLLSATTRSLVPEPEVEDLGAHALKDFPAPQHLFHLRIDDRGADQFAKVRTLQTGRTNLPDQASTFVGRDDELARLRELLATNRLVSLVGTGGMGKTRLAIELGQAVLDEYPDGIWLVDLTGLTDPRLVASVTARAVGVKEQMGRPVVETLVDQLSSRALLIVMDNCEHLIEACAALIDRLLASCGRVRVLATTREALNVPGECSWEVRSLTVPSVEDLAAGVAGDAESVRLFIDRARGVHPGFEPGPDLAAVAEVCRRLDGLALAIELAAARLRTMTVTELGSRLDDRFRLLTGGARTALPRHRTLEATIAWSYDLLTPAERLLFDRLAVFAGGFSLQAAERVCADEDLPDIDVLDLTSGLIERSMVTVDRLPEGRTRYGMLETLRQFGRRKLQARGTASAVRDRYLAWAAEFAQSAAGREELGEEADNLRAALDWAIDTGEEESALRIAARQPGGHFEEYARRYATLLPPSSTVPAELAGEVLLAGGELAFMMGDWPHGAEWCTAAVAAARAAGNSELVSYSATYQGFCLMGMDRDDDALPLLAEALAEARATGHHRAEARAMFALMWLYSRRDLEQAEATAREGLPVTDLIEDVFDRGHLTEGLGFVLCLRGRYEEGADRLAAALALARQIIPGCSAHFLETAAAFAAMTDRLELGAELLGAAGRIRDQTGDKPRPWERDVQTQWLPVLADRLPPDVYTDAIARGRALDRLEALEFAEAQLRACRGPVATGGRSS